MASAAERLVLQMVKIASWNVNGIRAVHKKGLFSSFMIDMDADVVCFQETKAEKSQSEHDDMGYFEYWNSAKRKGYSGTAIFSRKEPINVIPGLPEDIIDKFQVTGDDFGDPNEEGRVLVAEFPGTFVATVYTPNAKDDLGRLALRHKQWDPAFLAYMKRLEETKPVLFCGDLNVAHTPDDLANPKPNVGKKGFTDEEREGFQSFIDAGFVDTFRMFHQGNGYYTWWSYFAKARERNVGWRIDYLLASEKLAAKVKSADIHPEVMGSDHCPVSVTLSGQL